MSRLLSLPPELRKEIWDLLLAPNSTTSCGVNDNRAITAVSRTCNSTGIFVFNIYHSHAHEIDDITCDCHARSFYILNHVKKLSPAILRVNRRTYQEALPSLYERRTLTADPNRCFVSLWDRCSEVWFLLDRFLQDLPEHARVQIRSIKLPMILSRFEVPSAHQAFYNISRRLPNLQTVEIEFSPSAVRERWLAEDDEVQTELHGIFDRQDEDEQYFLGPVMAFADAKIIVTAVDKQDLGRIIFERVKPHIETRIWRQLLPMRVKKEQRRIARIRRALRALEYDEAAADAHGTFTMA